MSSFDNILNSVFDFWKIFIILFISYVFYDLVNLYYQVWKMPPGPLPLPLVGNLLLFKDRRHWHKILEKLYKKYGKVITFWLGTQPIVMINDIDIGKEAFLKQDFSGRPKIFIGRFICNDQHQDVVFGDGHSWKTLHKIILSAAQKYSHNKKLENYVFDCVEKTMKRIKDEIGSNEEFCPTQFIEQIFLDILAFNAFGKEFNQEELRQIESFSEVFSNGRWILWEYSKFIRIADWRMVNYVGDIFNNYFELMQRKFTEHYQDYNPAIERDFCDALIIAKNDALREGKESAQHLSNENLSACIWDLFTAGFHTSQITFQWILLLMAYYPEFQQKLRQEVETEIGDRMATHEDRNRCHYVMAFIAESLRFKNITNIAGPHRAIVQSKIGCFTIPKDTIVMVNQGLILTDGKYWPNAKQFRPERFIEDGKYMKTRPKAFIPFGVGRRVCPGEKLAIADLFLVLVRLLQSTSEYKIVLGENKGIDPNPDKLSFLYTNDFNIILKQI